MHYTGFPNYAVFVSVLNLLQPGDNGENIRLVSAPNSRPETGRGCKRSLTGEQQFLLTLMRIRRGFSTKDLGWLFGIDKSTVSQLFVSWVNFMYLRLSAIPIWPTREQVDATMPQSFKDSYPKTRVIIDCTELDCEAPTSLELKGNMYSNYKGKETYKALVGITPSGSISFSISGCKFQHLTERKFGAGHQHDKKRQRKPWVEHELHSVHGARSMVIYFVLCFTKIDIKSLLCVVL